MPSVADIPTGAVAKSREQIMKTHDIQLHDGGDFISLRPGGGGWKVGALDRYFVTVSGKIPMCRLGLCGYCQAGLS